MRLRFLRTRTSSNPPLQQFFSDFGNVYNFADLLTYLLNFYEYRLLVPHPPDSSDGSHFFVGFLLLIDYLF